MKNINLKRLNLGCDRDYKRGWINLDFHRNLKCDVVHNLNKFPWPFKDNQFDYVLANHVIEHLDNIPQVMQEIWRISKLGARIRITVPYFNSFNAYRDATHKKFFTWDTFSPFCGFVSAREKLNVGYLPELFKYKGRRIAWATTNRPLLRPICSFMNWFVNISPDFMERRIPFWITSEALSIDLIAQK